MANEKPNHNNCIFCQIIAGKLPAHKVYEDDNVLAFLDIHPAVIGHTLVIPKEHSENFLESSNESMCAVMAATRKIAPGVMRAVGATAFNLTINTGTAAGQVVRHTHFHIMPRQFEDGRTLWGPMGGEHDFSTIAGQILEELNSD